MLHFMEFTSNFTYIHVHFWECLPSILWWNTLLEIYLFMVDVVTQVYTGFIVQVHFAFIRSSYLSANSTTRLRLFQDNYWCVSLQGTPCHWILGGVNRGWSLMDKFPTIFNQNQIKFFYHSMILMELFNTVRSLLPF
jgi:hypothetical protein